MFTDVGQEIQHANELLVRLNQWKNWRQVRLTKEKRIDSYEFFVI